METIKLRYRTHYEMPSICCVCGEPAGTGRLRVVGSNWNNRRWNTLFFPLCDACNGPYATLDRRRQAGCWTGLALGLLAAIAGVLFGVLMGSNNTADTISGVLITFAIVAFVGGLAAYGVIPLLASRAVRNSYRRVLDAVSIKGYSAPGMLSKGSLTVCFAHAPFADVFKEMNVEAIAEEKKAP